MGNNPNHSGSGAGGFQSLLYPISLASVNKLQILKNHNSKGLKMAETPNSLTMTNFSRISELGLPSVRILTYNIWFENIS